MKTELDARLSESTPVLPRIMHLAEWARHANAYVDAHNTLPPDAGDRATREELIDGIEELGGLLQRYADSLRDFADREPREACIPAPNLGIDNVGFGTLLQFPGRDRSVSILSL